jgi:hypothetical protein
MAAGFGSKGRGRSEGNCSPAGQFSGEGAHCGGCRRRSSGPGDLWRGGRGGEFSGEAACLVGGVVRVLVRRWTADGGFPTAMTFGRRPSTRFHYGFWPSTTSEDAQVRGEGEGGREGMRGYSTMWESTGIIGGFCGHRRGIRAVWRTKSRGKGGGSREEMQGKWEGVVGGRYGSGGSGGMAMLRFRFQWRRERLEVGEEYDGWGPPIRKKRKIRKGKEEREGCCGLGRSVGLVALLGSGRGPNGVLHVFFLFWILFSIFCFGLFAFWSSKIFWKHTFELVRTK